ncbi:M20/M25/M40 family metallo-hydrolase [Candidatus Poriferisodalis sp.]|uniref:M20/M25/M40 family metallo-hydrolase n=1 Tax=Candidatus Poriferisodalis sp. TaxID=3101277 RepID=UPI003B01F5AA
MSQSFASGFSDEHRRTGQTVELLTTLIRNECVNDGTPESGGEVRNADAITAYLDGVGLDLEVFDAAPGRRSLVARIEGYDPAAPTLCLMGHTDVVPVNPDGWSREPFSGELIDGEIWGRGAVDMLNLTSSMAVAFRHLAATGYRPKGDLVYFACADEEAGSAFGARWMAEHHRDAISADYVLTENGGLHSGPRDAPFIGMNVGEKGVAWRRLRVRGVPGHGSRPFRQNNALVTAAAVVHRIANYRPPPRFHELWREQVDTLGVDEDTRAILLDESRIEDWLDAHPSASTAAHLYSCTHTSFSPNVIGAPTSMKTNVIPDHVDVEVDVRTLPGEAANDVQAHLDEALGDLADEVDVEIIMNDPASVSRVDTPLWDALQIAVGRRFPTARLTPQLIIGFTDSRVYRDLGAVAYGAGLFSPDLDSSDYGARFHGNDERIDLESLALTTQLWLDVVDSLWS